MPYILQCYSNGLLWAVEDDSAALLTGQSEFLQMVINEVQHRVHWSAQTALTVMPRPGDTAVFSQMCYIWSRCRHQVDAEGSSNPVKHTPAYILLTTCCCSTEYVYDKPSFEKCNQEKGVSLSRSLHLFKSFKENKITDTDLFLDDYISTITSQYFLPLTVEKGH